MKKEKGLNRKVTRRDFLKGLAAAGAFTGSLGSLGRPIARGINLIPNAWDEEYDVVVVGYAVAGACAAMGAHDAGADTLIVEWAPIPGGTTAMSGGMFNLGGGTALQRDLGVDESPEEYYKFLCAQGEVDVLPGQPKALEALQRVHVDHAVETYDWLENTLELPFLRLLSVPKVGHSFGGLMFLGNETYPSVIEKVGRAVPHAHMQMSMGGGFMKAMEDQVTDRGVSTLFNTRARHLIVDDTTGEVVGVKVLRRGREINIKARRGVVLAAGGFGHNKEIVKGLPLNTLEDASFRPGTNMGDGIVMAQEIGADTFRCDGGTFLWVYSLAHINPMADIFGLGPLGPWWNVFYIDRSGKRFVNEEWHFSAHALYWGRAGMPDIAAGRLPMGWVVFDGASKLALMGIPGLPLEANMVSALFGGVIIREFEFPNGKKVPCKTVSGMTISSLCEATKETDPEGIGINPAGLRATIDEWNRNLPRDPTWGRTYALTRFGTPPYYAAIVWPATVNESTGTTINAEGQVLDMVGKPIPRLYAAGRTTGGQYGQLYTCGTALSTGVIMGKIAGKNAGGEKRWVE